MNVNFLVNGRWYKTPCNTVLNADEFRVKLFTCKHTITANITDKCYFVSIDNIVLSYIKCDFYFSRNYTRPKEFLSNLFETFGEFISTTLTFLDKLLGVKRPIHKNTDEILDILFEEVIAIDREMTDTDPDDGAFAYDVVIHNFYGCDTYTVRANGLESAKNKALKIMKNECIEEDYYSIDSIRIYEENSDELLKEIIFEPAEEQPETTTEETKTETTAETEETTEKIWTVTQFPHVVRTFDKNGKMVYESFFDTAEKAYDDYVDIIENSEENLPYGEELTVVRYADGRIMCIERIKGTCIYNSMQKSKATEDTTDQDETTEPEILKPLEIIFDDENSKSEIRTKFYLLETYNRLNINHYYVELMTDKKIGDFYLYLKFDENSNEEMALCKIFHLNAEYRNNDFEKRFLYALAEKYNGLYCTPDYDDFTFYAKITEECKIPEVFKNFMCSGEKCFFISPDKNNKKSAINSMYGITANTTSEISNKYDETKELLTVEQFERLTGTLYKSLFKAIGLEETSRIPIIISNNMVFFNYNGTQYKYNPAQCKVYKKDGRKYQRINWKDFTDDNSPADQKQTRGRSPPLLLILEGQKFNDFKYKE